jgi:biopolymer transport protein ExbD
MRVTKKGGADVAEGDLTPMIDMTFQLIAFFMVLINFTQSEQNERIQLPDSVLAKPPEAPLEFPITIHLTKDGEAIIGGNDVRIEGLGPYLQAEANALALRGEPQSNATVIIRGHKDAKTGKVQDLIKVCQQHGFEKFALRAKEDVGNF